MNQSSFVKELERALTSKQMVYIDQSQGEPRVCSMGPFSRIWHWNHRDYHIKRLTTLATTALNMIEGLERMDPTYARRDPTIKLARSVEKYIEDSSYKIPAIERLKTEIAAARLGITSAVFEKNPGFREFADKYYLYNYLGTYKEKLQVDPTTLSLSIKMDGNMTPWAEVAQKISAWKMRTENPTQPWVYGPKGIQNRDMCEWETLESYIWEDPQAWNHQYAYDERIYLNPRSRYKGNHYWLEFRDPEGNVRAPGLYVENKNGLDKDLSIALSTRKGYFQSPDPSVFWGGKIYYRRHIISKEEFLAKIAQIELDHKKGMAWQQSRLSCETYGDKIGQTVPAGTEPTIQLPPHKSAFEVLTPTYIYKHITGFVSLLPKPIQKVVNTFAIFLLNLMQISMGVRKIEPGLSQHQKSQAIIPFNSFWDLFKEEEIILPHPALLLNEQWVEYQYT